MPQCERCRSAEIKKLFFIKGRNIHVCSRCAAEVYSRCDRCRGNFSYGDIVFPTPDESLCVWCAKELYLFCPRCFSYVKKDEAVTFHEQQMCRECREDYFSSCPFCGKKCETPDLFGVLTEDGYSELCPDCRKNYDTCCACGYDFHRNKLCRFEEQWYCTDCLQSLLTELEQEMQGAAEHNRILIQRIAMVTAILHQLR